MLTLKTNLTNDDYRFNSFYLKLLVQQRGLNSPQKLTPKLDKTNDSDKNFDKLITSLAEHGQIEAMEMYCNNLSPMSTFNSKIASNFLALESKDAKEPRENLALFSYYNWYANYYKLNRKSSGLEDFAIYQEICQKAKENYNSAFQQLYQLGKIDPIAKCSAFLLRKQNLPDDEYLRTISNLRNQIFEVAKHQINEEKRLKLMSAYCCNLVLFAPISEYKSRQPIVNSVLSSLQKNMISVEEDYSETIR